MYVGCRLKLKLIVPGYHSHAGAGAGVGGIAKDNEPLARDFRTSGQPTNG